MKILTQRFYWLFLMLAMVAFQSPIAAQHKKKTIKGNTEQGLVFRINACLANEDPDCYISLFPDMDTFSKMVMAYTDSSSKEFLEMYALQQQPTRMFQADSNFRARLKLLFEATIAQGKEEGIHWGSVLQLRYELVKARPTRNAVYEKLAPNRFTGYFFVQDALTRKTFGFTVSEMLQIGEEWYGGYIGSVFEASNKDEYDDQLALAKKNKREGKEPVKKEVADADKDDDQPDNGIQKAIADRKYYSGKFDNEIAVQLYVRSLKGSCPEGICSWEAIYKFGDQDDYILLTVTKDEEGDWVFTEVPEAGSMDLKLKGNKYTGTWMTTDNQTGYDVRLIETPASNKKIAALDEIFMELKKTGGPKKPTSDD